MLANTLPDLFRLRLLRVTVKKELTATSNAISTCSINGILQFENRNRACHCKLSKLSGSLHIDYPVIVFSQVVDE